MEDERDQPMLKPHSGNDTTGSVSPGIPAPLNVTAYPQSHRPSSPGIPAVTPYLVPATENGPCFTEADVRAFLEDFDISNLVGPTVSGKPFTIRKIQFMTNKEAFILAHGSNPGLADDVVVCMAELYGPFYMTAISVPPGRKPFPPRDLIGIVFDGRTGKIIMTWEYNDPKTQNSGPGRA